MEHLETINLSQFRKGNDTQRAEFCASLFSSFANKGFVKIDNHGLSAEYVAEGFRYNRELFRLPYDTKMTFAHPPRPNPHRGYSYVGQENISGVSGFERGKKASVRVKDLKESFDHGAPENEVSPNVWPLESDLPGFKEYMLGYYERCYQLHLELMGALAMALGLPSDSFNHLHDQRVSELRCLHYLEVPLNQVGHQDKTRIAEHTDFGSLTLLMQDGSGGLEIKDPATHEWYAVECPVPTLIVNVGDSMMRWMNCRIHSACHRVPLSAAKIRNGVVPARYSIAYFGKPNPDVSLKPFQRLVTEQYPCRYEDITAHDYDQTKLRLVYDTAA